VLGANSLKVETARSRAIRRAGELYRVDASRCGCCGIPSDDLYVLTDAAKANHAVCLDCIRWTGDGGLIRRTAHFDHEQRRLRERLSGERRRTT
jgi:hypothetical protein